MPSQERLTVAVAAFMACALMLGLAALAYAQLAGTSVFSCDRGEDACVLADHKPFWIEELDRFKATHLREARHATQSRGRSSFDCALLTVSSRSAPVEICGRAGPEYSARINAFVADPARPRFEEGRDTGFNGRMLAGFLAAFAIPPFLAGLWLLRRRRGQG